MQVSIGKMIVEDGPSKKMEMATFLSLKWKFCKATVETYSSSWREGTKAFKVNQRSFLAMLETGGGITSLQKICSAVTGKCLDDETLDKSWLFTLEVETRHRRKTKMDCSS